MSIHMYTGIPGSGKSLSATQKILEYLKSGKEVVSNYPITFNKKEIKKGYKDRFTYLPDEEITVKYLFNRAIERGYTKDRKEIHCLVVIDECASVFNCRDFGDKNRKHWLVFFRLHRKLRYNLILVTQQDRMIDRQIRAKVEKEFHHRKLQNIYWWFALLPVKLFVRKEYYYGMSPKIAINWEFFRFRKSIGKRYDTFALFDGQEYLDEISDNVIVADFSKNVN